MTKTVHNKQKLRQFLTSFVLSLFIVGLLLGNVFFFNKDGFPKFPRPIGFALVYVGYIALIPPGVVYLGLAKLGFVPEPMGRESFIRSNPVLWIFCVIFYAFSIYFIRRLWQYWKRKKEKLIEKKLSGWGFIARK